MSSRPNDGAPASGRDSTANLLRLFKTQPDHHVVTRQDLTRDYDDDDDDDNCDGTSTSSCPATPPEGADDSGEVVINNYYTWNSSKTNASILKYVWFSFPFYHRASWSFLCSRQRPSSRVYATRI